MLIARKDDFIINTDAIANYYVKLIIKGSFRKKEMAMRHKESYKELYKHQQQTKPTSIIEFYPFLNKVMNNLHKLPIRQLIIAKEYIMNDYTKSEIQEKFGINLKSIGNIRNLIISKLKRKDPRELKHDHKRGHKTQPITFTIIKLRDEKKMMYKDIAKVVNLNENQVKLRYFYHKKAVLK